MSNFPSIEKQLTVALTEAELVVRGDNLAQEMEKIENLKIEKKAIADQIKAAEARQTALQQAILYKQELRMVECVQIPQYESSKVRVVRTDTGETVLLRPMSLDEKQLELALEEQERDLEAEEALDQQHVEETEDETPAIELEPEIETGEEDCIGPVAPVA